MIRNTVNWANKEPEATQTSWRWATNRDEQVLRETPTKERFLEKEGKPVVGRWFRYYSFCNHLWLRANSANDLINWWFLECLTLGASDIFFFQYYATTIYVIMFRDKVINLLTANRTVFIIVVSNYFTLCNTPWNLRDSDKVLILQSKSSSSDTVG